MAIEVTDKDLYELLGRKDVEIFNDERVITNFQVAFEKMKEFTTEMETLKVAKTALEVSNKTYAEKNVQLDQALTAARQERDMTKRDWTNTATELNTMKMSLESKTTQLDVANAALKKSCDDYTTLRYTCDDLQKQVDDLKTRELKKPEKWGGDMWPCKPL